MWKSILGEDEEQQDNFFDDQEGLCAISPLQRVYGFAACMVAGIVCMFLSFVVFVNPIKFGLLFTFGNLLAIGSTAFLIGPGQQITMMLDPVRVYATAVYVGCVVLALICALWPMSAGVATAFLLVICLSILLPIDTQQNTSLYFKTMIHSKILTMLAIICEVCALIWYSLSYIPFARRMVSDVTIRLFDTEI